MSDFQRVKHPIFGHFSARRPEVWGGEVVDESAVDHNGKPRAAKPRISVKTKAKQAVDKADSGSPEKVE